MSGPAYGKHLRTAVKVALWILILLFALFIIFGIHQCILPFLAFLFPALATTFFDFGVYGLYPTQPYISFNLTGPRATHPQWDEQCDQGLVLLTPNGPSVERPGPMILDAQGDLVWMSDDFGSAANLKVQSYNGTDYLTFWSGDKAATSGKGYYLMMDSTYLVTQTVSAVGDNLFGDLHEYKITPDDTALMTVYNTTSADLTGMGMGRGINGGIVDNLFQEINIETGELLFQWRASDHFDPVDTFYFDPFGGYSEESPFDWYHLNSVDKDSQDNYIISSRHFHHVMCISPEGETLWILGGRGNHFTDLSEGKATNFAWQHDARWVSEADGILSLFDNSHAGPAQHSEETRSRVLFIQLDIPNHTAKLVHSLTSLQGIAASSQGSVQTLPDSRNIFVGWGPASAYSEYSRDGELICETHLGASWFYWWERMKSYRTTKTMTWHGIPYYPPQANLSDDAVFVSWNGATEVAYWALEGTRDEELPDEETLRSIQQTRVTGQDDYDTIARGSFEIIEVIPKVGFEGSFELPAVSKGEKAFSYYRVAALDSNHEVLRFSEILEDDHKHGASAWWTIRKVFVVIGILGGLPFAIKHFRRGLKTRNRGSVLAPAWMDWHAPTALRHADRSRSKAFEWIQMKWTQR